MRELEEIIYYDEEVTGHRETIADLIEDLNDGKKDKKEIQRQVEKKLVKAKQDLRRFENELKVVPHDRATEFEEKYSEHVHEIQMLENQLKSILHNINRKELLEKKAEKTEEIAKTRKKNKKKVDDVVQSNTIDSSELKEQNDKIADELFNEVFAAQDESLEIVNRLISKSEETNKLAQDSLQILAEQKEKLNNVEKELDKLGGNLARAGKELATFARQTAKQKIALLACIGILFIAFIVIIIVGVVLFLPDSLKFWEKKE